ncbi:MAG TPA: PAS domain S-box protein [bacterium]|nr:PAS domain S-box protein [bacterium]
MDTKFYKNILDKAPIGYAYHKIILDDQNQPVDYRFLKVNSEFERLTGLKSENILNKRVTEVLPGIRDEFDWISVYGSVALNMEEKNFEQYSEALQSCYKIKAYAPKKYYFVTIFKDITPEIEMVKSSQQFLEQTEGPIDYQAITDNLLNISGAKYIAFNEFEEGSKDFRTRAISGISQNIQKGLDILGFNPVEKHWKHDPIREQKISGRATTYFDRLRDLTGEVIPRQIIASIENIFNLGQTVIVKITKDGNMLGDFTIMMPSNRKLQNQYLIETYAQQVGLYLGKRRAESRHKSSEERYRLMVKSFHDGITVIQNNKLEYVNDAFAEMLNMDKDELENLAPSQIFNREAINRLQQSPSGQATGNQEDYNFETVLFSKKDNKINARIHSTTIEHNDEESIFATIQDITKQKQIIGQLKQEVQNSHSLDNFIAICAGCHKIRDKDKEGNPWISPAEYVTKRLPDVQFSHGMCPECIKKWYPEYIDSENED